MKKSIFILLIGFFSTLGVVQASPQELKKDPVKKEVKADVLDVVSNDVILNAVFEDVSPGYSWQDIEETTILTLNFTVKTIQPVHTAIDEGVPSKGYIRRFQSGNSAPLKN